MWRLGVRTAARVAWNCPSHLPAVLLDRMALSGSRARSAAVGCGLEGFHLDTRTLGRVRLLAGGDVHELREIAVSNMYCAWGFMPRSGWTVLDIGANVGLFSRWTRGFMRSGLIIAVEPVPLSFHLFWENLGLDGARGAGPTVLPVHAAVSDHRETLELLVPHGPLGWSAAPGWACAATSPCAEFLDPAGVERIRVEALPLDALLAGIPPAHRPTRIDLLKIDVEGMELECLRGAGATLAATRRVVFEYHNPGLRQRCAEVLEAGTFREVLRRAPYGPAMGLSFWTRRGLPLGGR